MIRRRNCFLRTLSIASFSIAGLEGVPVVKSSDIGIDLRGSKSVSSNGMLHGGQYCVGPS